MKLTREEAINEHRKMWRWISIETIRKKRRVHKFEYLDSIGLDPFRIRCQCFCCEYSLTLLGGGCKKCIIQWGGIGCCDENSFLQKWMTTEDYKKAALLAYKISKLPERKIK